MNTIKVPDLLATPNEQDVQLIDALADLQAIVDNHFPQPITSVTEQLDIELQAAVAKLNPYVKFEFAQSDHIRQGMLIECAGNGGFMIISSEGRLQSYQTTNPQDSVRGKVSDVFAYPVPTLQEMIIADTTGTPVAMSNRAPSALLLLEEPIFFSPLSDNGGIGRYDLNDIRVAIPLVYGMQFRVSNTFKP